MLHPIAAEAATYVVEDAEGRLTLSDEAAARLTESLAALHHDEQLRFALESLVALAAHLEEDKGAADTANRLLHVAATAAGALRVQNENTKYSSQDNAESGTGDFDAFRGQEKRKKAAPKFGAAAPIDALSLNALFVPTKFG